MNKIEKMLKVKGKSRILEDICDLFDYNDAEREVAAEVLLFLEMRKKELSLNR